MEPMNLGSPSGSGASPAYLPCFLLGDQQAPSPDKSRNISFGGASPQDYNRSMTGQRMLFSSQYQQTPTPAPVPSQMAAQIHLNPGPPTVGLFDTVSNHRYLPNPMEQSQLGTPIRGQNFIQQQPSSNIINSSTYSLNQSVHPLNDSYLSNNASLNASRQIFSPLETAHPYGASKGIQQSFNLQRDNFWITVFGYPPSESNTILQHFTNCGKIVDKILAPNNGNWMHIRFFSRSECDRALNYNEKILFNNLMIGVTICRDRSILEKENICESPRPQIRSLAKSTSSPVIASPLDTRPSSFLNRAMDVFLNW